MNEQARGNPDAEAIRDQWEIELSVAEEKAGATAEETRLAASMRQSRIPILRTPPENTWIWSDLHLGDRSALFAWNRPFRNVNDMNRRLLREWSRRVRAGDTIICLGNVAHPDAWRQRRLLLDLRNCPGERLLVLGNHDRDTRALAEAGFTATCAAALCATEPVLTLSHAPLRRVPPTTINVHGHLHAADAPSNRHVNVSVEHTDYAPLRLQRVLEIARRRTGNDEDRSEVPRSADAARRRRLPTGPRPGDASERGPPPRPPESTARSRDATVDQL